jgi:opacity protein-like surface antigen
MAIKNKITFIPIILTFSLMASYATPVDSLSDNHFYVGANVDYIWINFKNTIIDASGSQKINDNESGYTGGANVGYQWNKASLRYALEMIYDYDDVSHLYEGVNSNCENILNYDVGLHLHIGRLFTNKIYTYGILGVNYGHFEYKRYDANTGDLDYTNTFSEPGYSVGLGSDYDIGHGYSIRVIYTFSQFANKDDISGSSGSYDRSGYAQNNEISFGLTKAL